MTTPAMLETRLPWYRAPVLLLALALPMFTVVAGIATYRIAAGGASDSDPDAVRRVAQMQTTDVASDELAARLGLAAFAAFDPVRGSVRIRLDTTIALATLELRLIHATQARFDQTIALVSSDDGIWTGVLAAPRQGVYNVALHAKDADWRLVGRLDANATGLRLQPALGKRDG
jgi:uncharacterized protein